MGLSERKYINNTRPELAKYDLGTEIRMVGGSLTPNQLFSKSIYDPSKLSKTLPATTMKKIKNLIPSDSQNVGKSMGGAGYVSGAIGALNTAMDIVNSSKPTVTKEELMSTAKSHSINVNGIQTEQYGPIDTSAADVDVAGSAVSGLASGAASGAALGSVIPGLGTVAGGVIGGVIGGIGGLFGGKSKKKAQEEAARKAQEEIHRKNQFLLENAQAKSLKMKEAEEIGDMENQPLFHRWAYGKDPDVNPNTGATYKNYTVNTAQGKQTMPQNAWVSKGEVIKSADGSMYRVKEGKNDTARAYIRPGDTIYSKSIVNPETGNKIADDVELYDALGILPRLEMNQKMKRNELRKYKCGIEKFGLGAEGYANILSSVAGLLGSYKQYSEASKPLYTPSVSTENAYLGMIPKLMSLRQDYYPLWHQNREIEARGKSSIRNSGGLSAGQKALAYASLYNNTQQNNAKALFDTQLANNQLKSKAYETALSVGAQDAARKQQANIFNTEMLSKAHNSSLQGRQMAMYNGINALQNYFANQFKINQFNKTLAMYYRDMEERRKDRK